MIVENINKEIKSVFTNAIEVYNDGATTDMGLTVGECNYKKTSFNNIESIVLKYQLESSGVINPDYYTYNIDTTTGELITFKDAYTMLGYDEETINEKVNTKIVDLIKQMNFTDDDQYMIFSNYNYKQSIKDKNIKFYIDENKNLNIVLDLYVPIESGVSVEVIAID